MDYVRRTQKNYRIIQICFSQDEKGNFCNLDKKTEEKQKEKNKEEETWSWAGWWHPPAPDNVTIQSSEIDPELADTPPNPPDDMTLPSDEIPIPPDQMPLSQDDVPIVPDENPIPTENNPTLPELQLSPPFHDGNPPNPISAEDNPFPPELQVPPPIRDGNPPAENNPIPPELWLPPALVLNHAPPIAPMPNNYKKNNN